MSPPTGMELCLAAQDRLEAAGVPDASLDASRLFHHALNESLGTQVKQHHLSAHLMAEAPVELIDAYERMIAARATRQPVAQIIGRRAFWNHDFRVTRDTLDPRPDTETLIEAALALPWTSVLDLGTGTGAILISLLAERVGTVGLGTDISDAALVVARQNAADIGAAADFRRADWFDGVEGRFDLIVSNPPYIALEEMAGLSPEVRDWEPHAALTDGGDGLSAYRRIAEGAGAHLTQGGHLLVEIGWQQGPAVAAIFAQAGGEEIAVLPDIDGRDRVVRAKFGKDPL